jgi:hypothetical protein
MGGFHDTTNFVLFAVAVLLLAVFVYRTRAHEASLPKPRPGIGFAPPS